MSACSPTRLQFAGYAPAVSVYSRAARRFKELVESGTDGRVLVDLYWNVLDLGYTAEQLVQLVDSGVLAGCYMSTSYLARLSPRLGVFDLPFVIGSRAQAFALLDGPAGARMAAELEAATGLLHLGYWENGFRHVSNGRRPVHTLADLAGLRIRLQPNLLHERAFRLLGAEPVCTDVADLVPALREGRVDGQENPLDNIWTYGVYTFTPYVTLTAHLYGVRGMYLNRARYESLDPASRDVVREAGRVASVEQRAMSAERDGEMRGLLEGHGVEIYELKASQRAEFIERVRPLVAEASAIVDYDLPTELGLS